MDFTTDAHEQAYEQVREWVTQMFGESAYVNDEQPSFSLPLSRTVGVGVQSFGDDGACIDFFTWPLRETHLPEDAYEHALRTNAQYRFGQLNIQADGALLLEYVVNFNGLTKAAFSELASMISSAADEIAVDLGTRFFGGNLVE
jgi:hypothetical protein